MTRSHRTHLLRCLRLKRQWLLRLAVRHPAAFRQIAQLRADDERPLAETLEPWQLADLEAMDAGWLQLAGRGADRNACSRSTPAGRSWGGASSSAGREGERRGDGGSTSRGAGGAEVGGMASRPEPGRHAGREQFEHAHPPVGVRTCHTLTTSTPAGGAWGQAPFRRGGVGACGGAGDETEPDPAVIRRAYIERARGHSKTFDMAIQVAWILLAARRPLRGMVAAADRDQARLIHRAVKDLAAANPWLCRSLSFVENEVRCTRSGATLQVLSSDVSSSWGALPDFVICDELCHWQTPELWHSLLSSAGKQPECLLIVLTNAGVGRSWQWDVREHARQQPGWYFSSLTGAQASWIDEAALAEQRALLPPAVYSRLWENAWQHSDGEYVSLGEAEACRDESLQVQQKGAAGREYFAAVDYAEKHDLTVGCVVHREADRIVVDRMDVVQPKPGRPTPVAWVEEWIESVAGRFINTRFVLDEHQLVGTIQKLEGWHDIRRFDFLAGRGNHRLAVRLRQLILQRLVAWYPGCGRIRAADGRRDDLETELASLVLQSSETGRLRIDHPRDGVHHDDRAFALGAACLHLSEQLCGGPDLFVIAPPRDEGFVWSGFL